MTSPYDENWNLDAGLRELARVHTFATPVHDPRGSTWQTCTGCGVVRGTERTRFCRRLVVGPNGIRCNGGRV